MYVQDCKNDMMKKTIVLQLCAIKMDLSDMFCWLLQHPPVTAESSTGST